MYASKLAEMIDTAVRDCIESGSGKVESGNLTIEADWVNSDRPGYDVVEIVIMEDGRIKFYFNEHEVESY